MRSIFESEKQREQYTAQTLAAYKVIGRCYPGEFVHNLDILITLSDEFGWELSEEIKTNTGSDKEGLECLPYYRFRHVQQYLQKCGIIEHDGDNKGFWRLIPALNPVATIDIYKEAQKLREQKRQNRDPILRLATESDLLIAA